RSGKVSPLTRRGRGRERVFLPEGKIGYGTSFIPDSGSGHVPRPPRREVRVLRADAPPAAPGGPPRGERPRGRPGGPTREGTRPGGAGRGPPRHQGAGPRGDTCGPRGGPPAGPPGG